jgi:putative DNA primase/helicase
VESTTERDHHKETVRASLIQRGFTRFLEDRGHEITRSGNTVYIHCVNPNHPDRNPSMAVYPAEAKAYCFGCGMSADVFDLAPGNDFAERLRFVAEWAGTPAPGSSRTARRRRGPMAAFYDYPDANGRLVFQVVRHRDPKAFRQRQPDGSGGWVDSLAGIDWFPLFDLPALAAADPAEPVLLCEGEKDALAAQDRGFVATTNAMGAANWRPEYAAQLAGRNVVLVLDADEAGRKRPDRIGPAIIGAVRSLRFLDLHPGQHDGADLADWFAAGGTPEALRDHIADAPGWESGKVINVPLSAHLDHLDHLDHLASPRIANAIAIQDIADVVEEEVRWLWEGLIPRGKLVIFAGEGGLGKSSVLVDLAARMSRGGRFPDGSPAPLGKTLIFAAEDGAGDTIKPRFRCFGGDMSAGRLSVHDAGAAVEPFRLDDAGELALEETITTEGFDLVVFDPVASFLPDLRSDVEDSVRPALMRLVRVAAKTGAAIVVVRHTTKGAMGKAATERVLGSGAWTQVPRVAIVAVRHPHDPEAAVLGVAKANLSRRPPALAWSRETDGPLRWRASDMSIDEAATFVPEKEPTGAAGEATDFLNEMLAGGMRRATEMQAEARNRDIAPATLNRAKTRLGIASRKIDGVWFWGLPTTTVQGDQGDQGDQGEQIGELDHLADHLDGELVRCPDCGTGRNPEIPACYRCNPEVFDQVLGEVHA